MMEHKRGAGAYQADIVESAGETTAAATGSAEIGAAAGETGDGAQNTKPVGADTMVKVEGEAEPGEES